jgi:hypothetical protein
MNSLEMRAMSASASVVNRGHSREYEQQAAQVWQGDASVTVQASDALAWLTLACFASGIADIARGLAVRLEHDLLVGFSQLPGFVPPDRQFACRQLRRLAHLFSSARFQTFSGAQFACGRGRLARSPLPDDGRIV